MMNTEIDILWMVESSSEGEIWQTQSPPFTSEAFALKYVKFAKQTQPCHRHRLVKLQISRETYGPVNN